MLVVEFQSRIIALSYYRIIVLSYRRKVDSKGGEMFGGGRARYKGCSRMAMKDEMEPR